MGEGDDALTVASGVSTNYAEGEWVRAAFNITKRVGGKGLVELYVNGVRSAADEYGTISAKGGAYTELVTSE